MEQPDYNLMMQEIQQVKYKYIIILLQKQFTTEKTPHLSLDSLVRTAVKKKTFTKGHESKWSSDVYKIIHISNDKKQYLVNDGKRRVYNRWELLKISGAEGKDG